MLHTFTVVVNFIALAVAVWLGIYIVTRSPRSAIAWLAGLALGSLAGFFFNVLLALNPPPSPALLPLWMRPCSGFGPKVLSTMAGATGCKAGKLPRRS